MGTCNQKPCGCEDKGLTTQPPCGQGTPECPDPNPCAENFDSKCIMYNGVPMPCIGVTEENTPVETVLESIYAAISPLVCLHCVETITPDDHATAVSLTPTLFWSTVPAATGYDVYFDTVNPPVVQVLHNVNVHTYTPSILLENTTYYWQVIPVNAEGSAQGCTVNQFTTIHSTCMDPINYFFHQISITPEMNIEELTAAFQQDLEAGVAVSNCDVCCPDCQEYVLGNVNIVRQVLNCLNKTHPCCINFTGSGLAIAEYIKNYPGFGVQCCNDFSECIQTLAEAVTDMSVLSVQGIVEYSTINDNTEICNIVTVLQTLGYSAAQIQAIMGVILHYAIVIQCTPSMVVITDGRTAMVAKGCSPPN